MNANVATSTGYTSMYINAGKISNKGVELQVSGDIIKNPKGFNWTATLTGRRIRVESMSFIQIPLPDSLWTLTKSVVAGA